jgi:hypothetical protein
MSRGGEPPTALTPAQRVLFASEPGLPAEAVTAALKGMGERRFRHLPREDMLATAALAAMEAAVTFDPARGLEYRSWAFFAAMHAVMMTGREEHARYARATAMIHAGVLMYFGQASVPADVGFETESSLAEKLHNYTSPVVGLALMELAASRPTSGGEDEEIERLAAARAGAALRAVLPAEGSEERRWLDLHFGQRLPLTQVAAAMGVDTAAGYRTFVRRFHAVLASLREGLERRGIRELPPWRADVSGHALGDGGE